MNPRTVAKLEARIKETTAQVILRDLADPRLGFITVTSVKLSPELDLARISVSVLGTDGERSRTMAALQQARGVVQQALGRILRTRRTPQVLFEEDESIRNAAYISDLIARARSEDDAAARARGELVNPEPEHELFNIVQAEEVWIYEDEPEGMPGRIKVEYWVDGFCQFSADSVTDLVDHSYDTDPGSPLIGYETGPIEQE